MESAKETTQKGQIQSEGFFASFFAGSFQSFLLV